MKRKVNAYSLSESVIEAISKAAELENKSASRFIEDTMREKSGAVIAKHSQQQSLTNSANQAYKNEER